MLPDAASSSSKNCISVSSSAWSGMLLTKAILRHSLCAQLSSDPAGRELLRSAQRGGTRPPSTINGMSPLPDPPRVSDCRNLLLCALQCLTQILKNVVDVLDAHAEPNHLGRDTHLFLFFGG